MWYFSNKDEAKKKEEQKRSLLAISQFRSYLEKFNKVYGTYLDPSIEQNQIAYYLFVLGGLDFSIKSLNVRYEIFLDRLYELFSEFGLSEITTEIFIEFHINTECCSVAESVYFEGRNQYCLWSQLKDKKIYDWKKGFINESVQEESFPKSIQAFYVMVNKTDTKADYMQIQNPELSSPNAKNFELPFDAIIEDVELEDL